MDDINTTGWSTDDYRCMIVNDDKIVAIYNYDYDATDTEDYPSIIAPDTGSGRWFLHAGGIRGMVQFSIADPENMPTHGGRANQSQLVWLNDTGVTFNISQVRAISDVDDYTFYLYISSSKTDIGGANDTRVETGSFACSTNGTGGYYAVQNLGFEDDTVADGQYLIFQHTSGTAESLHVFVKGYFY